MHRNVSFPFNEGSIGNPLYRLHPAIGARPIRPDELRFLVPLLDRDMPPSWQSLPDDEEDDAYLDWSRAVLTAVAALGPSRIYHETSDKLGLDVLRALPGVTPMSTVVFDCDATPEVINALVRTNVARMVQTVGATPFLTVHDAWSGMFLHVAEPTILARFGTPWLESQVTAA